MIFNFEDGKRDIGKYHFDKILTTCAYSLNRLMNLSYILTYFSLAVVKNSSEFIT